MQALSEENFELSEKTQSFYKKLLEIKRIKGIKHREDYIPLDYELLVKELKRSQQQIRRYIVELEKAGVAKRHFIPSETMEGKSCMYLEVIKETCNE